MFVTPFISNPDTDKPWKERCTKITKTNAKEKVENPYHLILARECFNWFKSSTMIAILHTNSIKAEEKFELAVPLKRANMYLKGYQARILDLALQNTVYEPLLQIIQRKQYNTLVIFSPDTDVDKLFKIAKKTPQVIILAGVLHGKLMNRNEFLKMGKLDLTTAQAGLVQVLRTAAGGNLNQQLTHHQSTLVTRLKQIGTKEDKPCDVNE